MNISKLMPATVIRKAREYTRKLWVRVVSMGLMAFAALGLTQLFGSLVPEALSNAFGGVSVDRLLDIIANAMLAVTIFSITIMVSVYQSSSSQFTPRVHRLIIQDRTTQNTLAVFIGAYLYALVGIILRESGVYDDDSASVLFIVTVLVLAVIVIYLVRWVLHLQSFGSLIETAREIEDVTVAQFKQRLETPCLGANPLTQEVPEGAEVICAKNSGYVQNIYPEALQEVAQRHGLEVYLTCNIGTFVFVNEPLMSVVPRGTPKDSAKNDDSREEALLSTIQIDDLRTFDQDPRFGLVVMGEIASKALSPAVNDPGTAIDVISRAGRILSQYKSEAAPDQDIALDSVWIKPLDPSDLLEDGFGSLARDGTTVIEVQKHLQIVLSGLMRHPDDGLSQAARIASEIHLRRAIAAIPFEPDRASVFASAHCDVRDAVEKQTN